MKQYFHSFLTGMGSITLWPELPEPNLGNLSDDFKAVGDDIRKAMEVETSKPPTTTEPTNTTRRYSVEIRDLITGKWRVIIGDWGEKFIYQNCDAKYKYISVDCEDLSSASKVVSKIIEQREVEQRQ